MTTPSKIAWPDTDFFLHWRMLDEIDWPQVVDSEAVTLRVAQVVLRELNNQKDSGPDRRKKKRARAVFAKLREYSDNADKPIRADVTLVLEGKDPTIDFTAHGLRPEINDDWLIGSIIDYRVRNPDSANILITNDFPLQIKAKEHGIACITLPTDLKLPEETEEPKPNVTIRQPDLQLRFHDGESFERFTIPGEIILNEEELAVKVAKFRKAVGDVADTRYELWPPRFSHDSFFPSLEAGLAERKHQQATEAMMAYQRNLRKEPERYAEALKKAVTEQNVNNLTFPVRLKLTNRGNAPDSNIDVRLTFPSFVQVATKAPPLPTEYKLPTPPESLKRIVGEKLADYLRPDTGASRKALRNHIEPLNLSMTPSEEGVGVEYCIELLKHGDTDELPELFITFKGYEAVRGFQIDYQISGCESLKPLSGALNVAIDLEQGGDSSQATPKTDSQ